MGEYLIQDTTLTNIANAIRGKTGGTEALTPERMTLEIENIQLGEDVSAELTEQDDIIALMQAAIATKSAAGVAEPFAFISVTYPEGSVCTCTDGVETLTAKNTDGTYVFCVPYAATWTVTATEGDNSKYESVEIITEGQFKIINLFYFEYIINKGKLQEGYDFTKLTASHVEADGYAQFKTKTGTSGNGAAVIAKNNAILDLTQHSLLRIELEATSTRSGTLDYFTIGVAPLSNASTGHAVSEKHNLGVNTSLAHQIINLPVSTIDAGYLSLVISDNTGTVDLRIYNIWLE